MTDRSLLPVLIGQAPSRRTDGSPPFSGASGHKLEDLAGVYRGTLDCHFELYNLLSAYPGRGKKGDLFDAQAAKARACELRPELRGRRVVLVGWQVAKAFGVTNAYHDFLDWIETDDGLRLAVFPHPSGVNTWYNAPANRELAAAFLRSLV